MVRSLTRAEATAHRGRWLLVAAAERDELRATPVLTKARQLAGLMASVAALGWSEALQADEAETRNRWVRLHRALGA